MFQFKVANILKFIKHLKKNWYLSLSNIDTNKNQTITIEPIHIFLLLN